MYWSVILTRVFLQQMFLKDRVFVLQDILRMFKKGFYAIHNN